MSVVGDVRKDIRAAKKLRLPWWAVLCLLGFGMPLPWLFDHFGILNLFLPICNSAAVLGFAFVLKWRWRTHAWFWITMTVIAVLHVALILFVPWGTKWVPAVAIAGADSLDLCLILWILEVVRSRINAERD